VLAGNRAISTLCLVCSLSRCQPVAFMDNKAPRDDKDAVSRLAAQSTDPHDQFSRI